MPSDTPLPDRCGAAVTEKVGLEIHASDVTATAHVTATFSPEDFVESVEFDLDHEAITTYIEDPDRRTGDKAPNDYSHHVDDSVLVELELDRGDASGTVTEEPDFHDVMSYMRSEFDLVGATLELTGDAEPITIHGDVEDLEQLTVEIDLTIEDDDPYVRNRTTELQGYCLRYPMDNGRCYVHGGVNPGPGEDNANAMTHGLRAKRSTFYKALEDDDRAFVEAMVDSWLDDAPFERDHVAKVNELYRAAIDQLRLWFAVDEYVDDNGEIKKLAYDQVIGVDDSGNPITAEQANAVNLEYSRLDGDVTKKLKELGVLTDSPDSKQAEATMSLAQRLSGMGDNE